MNERNKEWVCREVLSPTGATASRLAPEYPTVPKIIWEFIAEARVDGMEMAPDRLHEWCELLQVVADSLGGAIGAGSPAPPPSRSLV